MWTLITGLIQGEFFSPAAHGLKKTKKKQTLKFITKKCDDVFGEIATSVFKSQRHRVRWQV